MSKRVVFTSDIQLHNHKQDANLMPSGLNSRFHYGLESLKQAAALAQGGVLVINGDLFDHRRFLEIDVMVHTFRVIKEISATLEKVIIVVGNHDQFLRDGSVHSTEILGAIPNVTLVDTWEIFDLGPDYKGLTLCCHAFEVDLDVVRAFIKDKAVAAGGVLVLHQEVNGAQIGVSICKNGLSLGDLHPSSFEMVLLGHFHKPQELAANVHYIGSPYQVDRAEAGEDKRFIVWDDGNWAVAPVVDMPQYLKFKGVKAFREASVNDRDFIEIASTDADYAEATEIAKAQENVKVAYVPPVTESASKTQEQVSSLSVEGAVASWLKNEGEEGLLDKALSRLVA